MAVSMKDLDPAFQGAGQKAGLEIWRIEDFKPVAVPESSHGKFFTGDSYVILKTTALKSGVLRHDIHYWLSKDTSQDEAGTAAIKSVELDAALGGRAVQYREVQGHETEKFLSYFKPCIIPQEGGVASGFKHAEAEEHQTRLFMCRGKYVVHVTEVPFARSSLNHDDIFILDTESKIFQFNGSNSSIQERAKALEVVQYIKDTYHDGKCDITSIEDGKMMADADSGEFWGLFGGFAPLPRKKASQDMTLEPQTTKLYSVEKGQAEPIEAESLGRELLETDICYILDCGLELYVWIGRTTSLEDRKNASEAAEALLCGLDRSKCHITRVIEGFETVFFRSKFDSWLTTNNTTVTEDGRGKVAALLKRQGLNVRGLVKAAPAKEEPQPHIDCTGNLQVWRVNGSDKSLLEAADQTKFYSGDCYIFQYNYPGEEKEEILIGTWFGKKSVEEDRDSAIAQASKMVESFKYVPCQARFSEGKEPIELHAIFQSFIVLKGGVSEGYKKYVAENEIPDETYSEDGTALFRIQGYGPDNMQAIQVEAAASSLNSSYCYILHNDSTVYTWSGNLTTHEDQELIERQLDLIKPNMQSKPQKEGSESDDFWELLGGKTEYSNQKISRDIENDPHLFSCSFTKAADTNAVGTLKVTEIYNFTQDDLMTEDIFILDCHSEIFVWVGEEVEHKGNALAIGEKFIESDFLMENLSREVPIYVATEGNEPPFFTRFFTWDLAKTAMQGNSFQRKLAIVKNGGAPVQTRPKRRTPLFSGGSRPGTSAPEKSQRSRSMTSSPDRARVRGRSPAFTALAATFENQNARNLSQPPPVVQKPFPKSTSSESAATVASRSAAIAALTCTFEKAPPVRIMPKSVKANQEAPKPEEESDSLENDVSNRIESLTVQEDVKEGENGDDERIPTYPYERLVVGSEDPIAEIDATKREMYLSSEDFTKIFEMTKDAFYKIPKWKQNKMKMALQLF